MINLPTQTRSFSDGFIPSGQSKGSWHRYPPTSLMHVDPSLQLCVPAVHSSTSENKHSRVVRRWSEWFAVTRLKFTISWHFQLKPWAVYRIIHNSWILRSVCGTYTTKFLRFQCLINHKTSAGSHRNTHSKSYPFCLKLAWRNSIRNRHWWLINE